MGTNEKIQYVHASVGGCVFSVWYIVCVWVWMTLWVYVLVCACVRDILCVSVCTYVRTCVCVCMHACMKLSVYWYVCWCSHCICVCVYAPPYLWIFPIHGICFPNHRFTVWVSIKETISSWSKGFWGSASWIWFQGQRLSPWTKLLHFILCKFIVEQVATWTSLNLLQLIHGLSRSMERTEHIRIWYWVSSQMCR